MPHYSTSSIPTPEEFAAHLTDIKTAHQDVKDLENIHLEMDEYICRTLELLGYRDGIRIFRSTQKYYA